MNTLIDIVKKILEECGFASESLICTRTSELEINLHSVVNIGEFLQKIKANRDLNFDCLMDVCGADYPNDAERFKVIYHLLSMKQNARLRIVLHLRDSEVCYSVSEIFKSAIWFEREVFDMYGIVFNGLADHRRILTDYNFEGYPLRKDFPLTGFKEIRYDPEVKDIVQSNVVLSQEFRVFDFEMPWEGTQYAIETKESK